MSAPENVALIFQGPDAGPEWDLLLLQDDGSEHAVAHITSADATGIGFLLAHAALSLGIRLDQRPAASGEGSDDGR